MADLNIKQLISYSSKGILSKELVKTERGNVALFCLAKGTEISEHTSTKSGMVYVVEGKACLSWKERKLRCCREC